MSEIAKSAAAAKYPLDGTTPGLVFVLREAYAHGYDDGMQAGDYHEGFEEGFKSATAALAVKREADRAGLEYAIARHRVGPDGVNQRSKEDVALAQTIFASGVIREAPPKVPHPALEQIAAMHRAKHGSSPRYAPDDYDHERDPVAWEDYVICDYDKTPWPCKTHLLLKGDSE